MKINQAVLEVLIDFMTIETAKLQMNRGIDIMPIDKREMNFRLVKGSNNAIVLQLLCKDEIGMWFKPIGFYVIDNSINFSNDINVDCYVLQEFEDDELINSFKAPLNNFTVKELGELNNAIIGAFSRDTFKIAKNIFSNNDAHKSVVSNGIKFNLTRTDNEIIVIRGDLMNPPIFVCGQYEKTETKIISKSPNLKNDYMNLRTMGLLSMYN